jgi:hypothetical protein
MKINEILTEKWSQKYKSSINCSHPKGFSQKAHCAGKKKHNESVEMEMVCEDCGMCQTHGNLNEIKKGEKDSNGYTRCWPGKHAEGTKKGKNGGQVRNCVPNESIDHTTGNVLDKNLADVDPPEQDEGEGSFVKNQIHTMLRVLTHLEHAIGNDEDLPEWVEMKLSQAQGMIVGVMDYMISDKEREVERHTGEPSLMNESLSADEQFDMIEDMVESLAESRGIDAEQIWEDLESFDDQTLLDESAAWHRKEGKSAKGGLNRKGVASYRREHPGSKLQMAVTTKPSKLKKGSKAAKRRKSFCARMSGVKGPMKKPNGKPTRKALALRKWNC